MRRTFTLAQANQLLPRITTVLRRTTQLSLSLASLVRKDETQIQAHLVEELLGEETRRLEKLGVVVRDLASGAIDFPSVLDGEREVVLCWRPGESEVRHFHDPQVECSTRRSVTGHHFFDRRQLRPPRE